MLTKKFLLCFLMPLVLLISGAGVALYFMAASELQDQVDRNLIERVKALDKEVAARIDTAKSDLQVLAAHPALERYVQFARFGQSSDAADQEAELQEHFAAVAEHKTSCTAIAFHAANGLGLAMVEFGKRSYVATDASDKAWFRAGLALPKNASEVSRVHELRTATRS